MANLKKEIIPNEKVLYYNNQNKVGETDFETYKKNRTIKKIVITEEIKKNNFFKLTPQLLPSRLLNIFFQLSL